MHRRSDFSRVANLCSIHLEYGLLILLQIDIDVVGVVHRIDRVELGRYLRVKNRLIDGCFLIYH